MRPSLASAVLAILAAVACGTPAPPPAVPEPVRVPGGEEASTPPYEHSTHTVQAETDPQAQLAAELEEKSAAEPGVLIGHATVKRVLHCGGAAPPPGQPYSVTNPYGGKILIRKGKKNSEEKPVAVVQTDVQGVFSADLPEGTYCLVESSKKDPPGGAAGMYVHPQCLQEEWKSCDAVVEHPSGKPVYIRLFRPCFGKCYAGPRPP